MKFNCPICNNKIESSEHSCICLKCKTIYKILPYMKDKFHCNLIRCMDEKKYIVKCEV